MSTSFDTSVTKISAPIESFYSNGSYQNAQTLHEGNPAAVQTNISEDLQPYRVTISEEALRKAGLLKDETQSGNNDTATKNKDSASKNNKSPSEASDTNSQEARELESLKRTDREVRAHEQAHVIAGGSLVRGAASFGYATGPDGKLYAVSGEVSIDSSPVQDDPRATISKMMRVIRAALAPAQPSGQDRAVASAATKTQVEAQQELSQQQMEKVQGDGTETSEAKSAGAPESKTGSPEKKPVEHPKSANESTGQSDTPKQNTLQVKHINFQA